MIHRQLGLTLVLLLCLLSPVSAQSFSIAGAVNQPGDYPWHPEARLRDAVIAGQVQAQAWFLGAALLRQSAIEPQQRLKAGILFELQVNRLHANVQNDSELAALIDRLSRDVTSMPVNGRIRAQLDPFQLLLAQHNRPLETGDKLIYPTRPKQIRIMGAVTADCALPFDARLTLRQYLRQCQAHPAADPDQVYVIQPDASVQQAGIALWNEQQINLAVGAVIYRPLRSSAIIPETAGLNSDLAHFLATQYQLGGRFSE